MRKLVYGVGINDAGYSVRPTVNDKKIMCPFYRVWSNMIERCYSDSFQRNRPTYIGCTVCDDWLTFSNFKSWMQKQGWQGMQIDKDILIKGNRIYSPSTCVFVSQITNAFTLDSKSIRGECPIGVSLFKRVNKFIASCSNPFTGKGDHLGYFNDEDSAHQAWKRRKHELACQLAELQTDERVANALRTRYL